MLGGLWQGRREPQDLRPLVERWGLHPALARFHASRAQGQRLLLINVPPGVGRELFAASWLSDFSAGYVLDLSSLNPHDEPNIQAVEAYLAADANRGVCVIADASTKLSEWRSTTNRVTAELPDLLLEQPEAERFYASLGQSQAQATFAEAWDNVGGWLSGLFAAHRYGVDTAGVLDVMTWALHNADTYTETLRDDRLAAFLTDYSENLLRVYYSSLVLNPPTLDSLSKSGLLVRKDTSWVMPIAIRQALKQHFWDSGGDESELLAFLLRAIARTEDVGTALEYGARQGDWDAVGQFLDEYWVELYTKEPETLLGVNGPFPEKLVQRFGDGNLSLRILTGALDGKPEAWRANPMPHDENPTVRRLRQLVSRSPEPATARTLTMNLLLLTYLRLSRYYAEATIQAQRLRDLTTISNDHDRLNPLMVAFLDLHVGLSLLKGLDLPGAELAFTDSYNAAKSEQNHFIAADAAGKLALLLMLDGRFTDGVSWYKRCFEHANQAPWGGPLIRRCGSLAKGLWQLQQLNYSGLAETLRELKSHHQDLFWEIELYLSAAVDMFYYLAPNSVTTARQALEQSEYQLSPLGELFLSNTVEMSRFDQGLTGEFEARPTLTTILFALQTNHPDDAARLLHLMPQQHPLGMWNRMLEAVKAYLRAGEDIPLSELAAQYRLLGIGSGSLLEALLVSNFPGSREVYKHLGLSEAESSLLTQIGEQWSAALEEAPQLTPREHAVLDLLRQGLSRTEIAAKTFRSENTVKAQIRTLYRKLDASNRDQALRRARIFGL